MKRTVTGIAAAALALGTLIPAAFAGTTTSGLVAAGGKTINYNGTALYTGVQTGTQKDAGTTTQYFPIYYLMQTLTKAGYTNTYNSTTHQWDITMPGVDASKIAVDGGVGTGTGSISINGTVVKKFNVAFHKDFAGGPSAQVTTYFPLYYLGNVLQASGFSSAWDGTSFNFKQAATMVTGVAATAADTIQVTFNQPVDTTKASFDVKEGVGTVSTNAVTWNASKTVATIQKSWGVFAADTYTVDVNGLGLDTTSYSLNIAAQKVAKITFSGSSLVKASNGQTATFFYHAFDQYGTDITSTANLQSAASTGNGTLALDPTTGTGTVTYNFTQTGAPSTVVVTLVDPVSGTSATQTMNVVSAASVKSFTYGSLKLASGVSHLYTGSATAGELAFTAVDQYGNNVTDLTQLQNSVQLLSSDPNVTFTFVDDNNVPYINVDTHLLASAETVTLTAVNSATGLAVSTQLQIAKPAAPAAVSFGQLSQSVLASGDDVFLPITVTDQFGNQLTADQIVAAGQAALNISGTGPLAGHVALVTDKNSSHYGQLELTPSGTGYATLISTVSTTPVTVNFNVQAARELTTVTNAPAVYAMQGATAAPAFGFKDQYGADFTPVNDANLKYVVTVTSVSGDSGAVTTNLTSGANVSDLANLTATAVAGKTGVETVTVKLEKTSDSSVVSEATATVNNVKNNVAGLTYSVSAIPTLNGTTNNVAASTDAYAVKVAVTAKDASGNTYVINPADVVAVSSSDSTVAAVAQPGGAGTAWYVAGQNVTTGGNTSNKTATLSVTVNTLDGVKTVTAPVTVSPTAATVTAVRVVNAALGGDTTDANLPTTLSDVSNFSIAHAATTATPNLYIIDEDQYGVWHNVTAGTEAIVVNSSNLAAVNALSDATNVLTLDTTKETGAFAAGDTITATIIVGGKSLPISVKVN